MRYVKVKFDYLAKHTKRREKHHFGMKASTWLSVLTAMLVIFLAAFVLGVAGCEPFDIGKGER